MFERDRSGGQAPSRGRVVPGSKEPTTKISLGRTCILCLDWEHTQ
jgi:hypothetical protein